MQRARTGEDINRQVAPDARLGEGVMLKHYVHEGEQEHRHSSNRMYNRLVSSMTAQLAKCYGYVDDQPGVNELQADMRHLIDTYIEADEPRKISPFDGMGLLDLIVKTGIADAIAKQLGGLKGNKNAIAETIENNVRSKIIKEHLNDPAYYEKMSKLLDEIITARKARAIEYEEYLKRIAELAKKVGAGQAEDTPAELNTPGRRALFNNLNQNKDLAIKIDEVVKHARPDAWRGIQAREQVIKAALYGVLQDVGEVERIFLIIKQQKEY